MSSACRAAFLMFSVLSLVACASRGDYAPSPNAPTAMVRFTSDFGGIAAIRIIDMSGCPTPKSSLVGALNHMFSAPERSTLNMLGTSSEPRNDVLERLITAGSPALIEVSNGMVPPCKAIIVFAPEVNRQYEIRFMPSLRCDLVVSRLEPDKGMHFNRVSERSARRLMATDFHRDLCQ
jgi:hypothetical protein